MSLPGVDLLNYKSFVRQCLTALNLQLYYNEGRYFKDKEMAKLLGISATNYSRIFTGVAALSGPRFYTLLRLLKMYNISIDERIEISSLVNNCASGRV